LVVIKQRPRQDDVKSCPLPSIHSTDKIKKKLQIKFRVKYALVGVVNE